MESNSNSSSNVIRFPGPRSSARLSQAHDQRSLMDAVYGAGSLPVAADDRITKTMATRLNIFGFVVIDEVQTDGTARRLRPSEAVLASTDRPWRISKPSSRYAVGGVPDSDTDLFSARPA